MVAPVTGPISTSYQTPWVGNYRRRDKTRSAYRQRRPYNLPLPFELEDRWITPGAQWASNGAINYSADASNSTGVNFSADFNSIAFNLASSSVASSLVRARTYARIRLNGKIKDSASLALMYAERRQSMDMLAARLRQMYYFAKELRRFNFRGALTTLTSSQEAEKYRLEAAYFSKKDRLKRSSKAFANNFLEFHFGWSALVNDIFTAVKVLQSGPPPSLVRSSYTEDNKLRQYYTVNPYSHWQGTHVFKTKVSAGCKIYVSNPNLWLANQLGIVNPATVMYDLVPFSFIANWFGTIEEFLSQWTEFWGLSVTESWYTESVRSSNVWQNGINPSSLTTTGGNSRFHVRRIAGSLPSVSLIVRKPWQLSPTRGLVAASLLLQQLH